MTPAEQPDEDRVVLSTRRMIEVAFLLLIVAVAWALSAWAWSLMRTPSSVPSRQDVQIGTVCPDPAGGA